ncbi:MAG: YqgE/AlgH family protein [Pseudomonadota bacterium]
MNDDPTFLTGQLLIAMPSMGDQRFSQSVICICNHDETGALGLVINMPISGVKFADLAEQLELGEVTRDVPVRAGGPVERNRGFLLHDDGFYLPDVTVEVTDGLSMTTTLEALQQVARGEGPEDALLCLGYSGWGPGQLERELQDNAWLTVEATPELVFSNPEGAWMAAIAAIGIDPRLLSAEGGQA